MSYVKWLKKKKKIVLKSDGTPLRDFISLNDVVKLVAILVRNKRNHKKIINLASGRTYSIIELAKLVVNNKYFKKTNIPIYFSNGTKYLKSKNHPIVNKKFKIDTSDLRKLGFKNNQKIEDGIFGLLKKYKFFIFSKTLYFHYTIYLGRSYLLNCPYISKSLHV